jgi:poly(3-hydroxybutyrate) depolymerase
MRADLPNAGGKYWLYVPSDYDEDRKWPLVVTLHGTHGWDSSRAQIREWKYLADRKGFIVAAPDLRSVQGILPVSETLWSADLLSDEKTILSVIDDVASKYRVDTDHVLLTGFSAGGYPLYYVGLRHPERFSMLIARNCNSSIKLFEQIELNDTGRALPVVIFWGKDDLQEINRQSWQAVRWLSEHGLKNVERKKYAGGHLRRPETAYSYWRGSLPPGYRR